MESSFRRQRGRRRCAAALLVLLVAAASLAFPGCQSEKKELLKRVLEKAGGVEPGTRVFWIRNGEEGEKLAITDPRGQWSTYAYASSSLADISRAPGFTAVEVCGPPDVLKISIDPNAWAPIRENAGYEWVEAQYKSPLHASSVRIREVNGAGCVAMVQLKDTKGNYHVKWIGTDKHSRKINWLVLEFPETSYLVNAVKVTLDTTRAAGWKLIDVIQIAGSRPR